MVRHTALSSSELQVLACASKVAVRADKEVAGGASTAWSAHDSINCFCHSAGRISAWDMF